MFGENCEKKPFLFFFCFLMFDQALSQSVENLSPLPSPFCLGSGESLLEQKGLNGEEPEEEDDEDLRLGVAVVQK